MMDTVLNDDVATAVAAVVRDALIEGQRIAIPELGTFLVRHEASRVHQQSDGSAELIPPRDLVAFECEAVNGSR